MTRIERQMLAALIKSNAYLVSRVESDNDAWKAYQANAKVIEKAREKQNG